MKTAPIEILRNPDAPKLGDFVLFRPWDKNLEDVSYWRRYANTSRWFGMDPEPKRELVGQVKAIKRVGEELYYRINSGMTGWDASPLTVRKMPDDYYGT
jgi:hypothetical protein